MNGVSSEQQDRPRMEWRELTVIADEETGAAVCVRCGEGRGKPCYLIQIGRIHDGRFMRDLFVTYDTRDQPMRADAVFNVDVMDDLVAKALSWLDEELERRRLEITTMVTARRRDDGGRPEGDNRNGNRNVRNGNRRGKGDGRNDSRGRDW